MGDETIQVLLVEDSPTDAFIVREELTQVIGIKFAVTQVERLNEGLKLLKEQRFSVVLLDLSLPDSDGFETFVRLREAATDVPIVVLSGRTDEVLAVKAVQAGAQDYLVKGHMEEHVLARAIRYAIERKRSEEALRMQSRVLESMVEGVNVSGHDGIILFSNPACDRMFGYARGELAGKHVCILSDQPRENDSCFSPQIQEALSNHGTWSGEISSVKKDGTAVLTQANITSLEIGGRKCAVAVHEDITQKKQIELHLLGAQRIESIGQLAAGVAHDFNNVIAVILGYAELIMVKLQPDDPMYKDAGEILQAAERAAALTRQLLVFSRKQTVQLVVLDINTIVEDTEKMLRRLIDENVELNIIPGKDIGRTMADAGYVEQVLMNLVVNARDAMPNGGNLTIETHNITLDECYTHSHEEVIPGDYVMLAVSDTGTGMTREIQERMFEAFFTTKPKGKGTGLGLATCQTIVKQCGGHIGIYSEMGKGTTFKIYFPRINQPADLAVKSIAQGPLPRGKETLLLVEDDPAVRHLACSFLAGQGYNVLHAKNGEEGLREVRNCNGLIRLVITDVIMPVMGGKVMADWLKTTNPDIEILFTSGYTDDAISRHGVLDPGIEFLSKPYTLAALTRKVREMLDNSAPKIPALGAPADTAG